MSTSSASVENTIGQTILVSNREIALSTLDPVLDAKERMRDNTMIELGRRLSPGKYIIEIMEMSRNRPDLDGIEFRRIVTYESQDNP